MKQLQNRTIVITGASAGVGRAIAQRLARAGARLGLIARDAGALEEVKAEVEGRGGRAVVAPADVADPGAVFAAAAEVEKAFGSIDVWINDAMVTVFSPIWEMTPDEFRRVTDVTYLGVVHGTMAALRHMRPRGRGTIIQMGSALAYRGIPLQSAYCGAKHAIRGFTNSVRAELIHARSAITISMVELPAVNTPQFDWARTHMPRRPRPVPPVVQPEVVADTVLRAVLNPGREYWIGWTTLKVILGNMLLPGLLDRYVAKDAFESQETRLPVSAQRRDNLESPIHELHRTHGDFDSEASSAALVTPGQLARIAPVVAGGLVAFGAGVLMRRLLAPRSAPPRSVPPTRRKAPPQRRRRPAA